MMRDTHRSCTVGCLGLLILGIAMTVAYNVGAVNTDEDSSQSSLLLWAVLALVGLAAIGLAINKKRPHDMQVIQDRRQQMNSLTAQYNLKAGKTKSSKEYLAVKGEYQKARASLLNSWEEDNKVAKPAVTGIWKALTAAGVIATTMMGSYGAGTAIGTKDSFVSLADNRVWSADNIPMPHMDDHSLYVSNPDSILSQEVEDSINATLGQLDDVLGIESAMVIVGHIQNDDPIGMVRGIYEKYKVGRDDRGLVIVVGYLDHSYFIAPGRSLEGDLTDAECERLARRYLIPSMKAELPDSGMLYLARGVLALMTEKDMPHMTGLSSASSDDGNNALPLMLYPFLLALWGGFCAYMGKKVGTTIGMNRLIENPFFIPPVFGDSSGGRSSGGSRSSGGGSSWSGGHHSSGGYGGGSWGGGGAGGRW